MHSFSHWPIFVFYAISNPPVDVFFYLFLCSMHYHSSQHEHRKNMYSNKYGLNEGCIEKHTECIEIIKQLSRRNCTFPLCLCLCVCVVKLHPNRMVFYKFPIKAYAFQARTSAEIEFVGKARRKLANCLFHFQNTQFFAITFDFLSHRIGNGEI